MTYLATSLKLAKFSITERTADVWYQTRPGSKSESEQKRARNALSESERDFFLALAQVKNFICSLSKHCNAG